MSTKMQALGSLSRDKDCKRNKGYFEKIYLKENYNIKYPQHELWANKGCGIQRVKIPSLIFT
jgi:hypothetical protein